MYQDIQKVVNILHGANIKSAHVLYDWDNNSRIIISFAWAEVPDNLKCPNNDKCLERESGEQQGYPCNDCPMISAVSKGIKHFKQMLEQTVEGIQLSNEIDWFKDGDQNNEATDRQFVFDSLHRIEAKRVDFYLFPKVIFKEENPGQLIKILGTWKRLPEN